MRKIWRGHSLTIVLLGISAGLGVVSLITGHYYWRVEGPKAHGDFWNWFIHHSVIEMFGEALVGGLLLVWLTKGFREKGSPESGDD